MLAFVYGGGRVFRLEERPLPRAQAGEITIRVDTTAICGSDIRSYRYGNPYIAAPRVIGHEVIGSVAEVGAGVSGFAEGDRVQVAPAIGCGSCFHCRRGETNLCDRLQTVGFDYDGSFAEYMRVPAQALRMENVTKLSPESHEVELVLAEPLACVMNAQQFLPVEEAEHVVIYGGGFIGSMHAELARAKGARGVVIVEPDEQRLRALRTALPWALAVNPRETDLAQEIAHRTEGRGADVSIVACSVGSAQTDALENTRKRGHVSLFGGLPGDSTGYLDSNLIHYRELSVHGVHASTPALNREALRLIREHHITVEPYVGRIFGLREIEQAFEAVNRSEVVKALIDPRR